MKCRATKPDNHPVNIQHTIAHLPPDNTLDIVKNKQVDILISKNQTLQIIIYYTLNTVYIKLAS